MTDLVAPRGILEPSEALPSSSLARLRTDHVAPTPEPQTRQNFELSRLAVLADSLRRSGLRQPIVVTPDRAAPGHYRIVAGERRWRAALLAGLTEIPCIVDEGLADPKQRLLAQAEENLLREDLNVVEEAAVLVQLMEAFSVGAEEAGSLIGRSYQQARRLIQIHEAPQAIREAIVQGHIDARAALELVRIHNRCAHDATPDGKRRAAAELDELIDRVVNERWSIRRLEAYARKLAEGNAPRAPTPRPAAAQGQACQGSPPAAHSGPQSGPARDAASPPYRLDPSGVFIDTGRIARRQVTPEEREELIGLLEHLLMAVRRAV